MAEPFDDTAKAFYRKLFQEWGLHVEVESVVFYRGRTIDFVVDSDSEGRARLQETVFSYFRTVNSVELKGPGNPLDLEDYNLIMSRAWGLGAMEREARSKSPSGEGTLNQGPVEERALPGNRTVTIVCVVRPDHILDDLRDELEFIQTAEPGIYWREGPPPCRIIVPSELPLEERNYPLLPLARGKKLEEFLQVCLEEGRMDHLQFALDVGLVSDPLEIGRRILEMMEAQTVTTDEMYQVFEEAFEKWPDLMWKFPSIRRALEAEARAEEQVRAAEELARMAEEQVRMAEEQARTAEEQMRATEEQARMAEEQARAAEAQARIAEERGEQHGEVRALQETLVRMLGRKFGELPPEVVSRVRAATDLGLLEDWLDRILEASSLAEMGLDGDIRQVKGD